jgi:hypothetical protein
VVEEDEERDAVAVDRLEQEALISPAGAVVTG